MAVVPGWALSVVAISLAALAFVLIFTSHLLAAIAPAVLAFGLTVYRLRRQGFPTKPFERPPD